MQDNSSYGEGPLPMDEEDMANQVKSRFARDFLFACVGGPHTHENYYTPESSCLPEIYWSPPRSDRRCPPPLSPFYPQTQLRLIIALASWVVEGNTILNPKP